MTASAPLASSGGATPNVTFAGGAPANWGTGNPILQVGGVTVLTLNQASGDFVGFGPTPIAASGFIRAAKNAVIEAARNNANSGDLAVTQVVATDVVQVGDTNNAGLTLATGGTNVTFTYTTGSNTLSLSTFQFSAAATNPSWNQATQTSDSSTQSLRIQAQSAFASAATFTNGGLLSLEGGAATSNGVLGLRGGVRLRLGQQTTQTLVEIAEPVLGQRVVSLCQGLTGVTSTQMPTGTGDKVIFLANAATAPIANSVGGGILYCTAGALHWRGTSGTDTTIAAA